MWNNLYNILTNQSTSIEHLPINIRLYIIKGATKPRVNIYWLLFPNSSSCAKSRVRSQLVLKTFAVVSFREVCWQQNFRAWGAVKNISDKRDLQFVRIRLWKQNWIQVKLEASNMSKNNWQKLFNNVICEK